MPRSTSPAARPRLDVQQLRAFISLIEHGGVTSAARALGIAQSTVSESLASLERALGSKVVLRGHGSRRMALTAAGEALLPHARAVLAAIDDAHSAVVSAANRARAALEVIANESVSTYLLPNALPPLRRRWPNTRFSITVAACAGVRQGIEDGRYDLGLLLETAPERSRRKSAVSPDAGFSDRVTLAAHVPLVVFVSPAHPLAAAGRGPVPRGALSEHPLFLSDAAGDFHTLVHRFFGRDGLAAPRLEAAGTVEGVKRAILADARALGILPAYAVEDDLRMGRLVRLELVPPPPEMELEALLPRSRARHPGMGDLLDAVKRGLDDGPGPHGSRRQHSRP